MTTYHQLSEILLAQGIARAAAIYPEARLVDDLAYDANDIAELAHMAERTFAVQIQPDEHRLFTNLRAVVALLNNKQTHFRNDLGLDSLDVTDLLVQVEAGFGLTIPDEDWWQFQTVGQLTAYLTGELITASPPVSSGVLLRLRDVCRPSV